MVLRSLTLDEWFLRYQLRKLQARQFFLPIGLEVDVTEILKRTILKNQRPPLTALCVKAASLLTHEFPPAGRVLFSTWRGPRLYESSDGNVNLPITIKVGEREVLSAIVIKKAKDKSLTQIQNEIREAKLQPSSKYPVTHFAATHANTFINRLKLKFLHWCISHFPSLYIRQGGGTISVSSLLNFQSPDFQMQPFAFGNTALTFCVSSIESRDQKSYLKFGVGYDHTAFDGAHMSRALQIFSQILSKKLGDEIE